MHDILSLIANAPLYGAAGWITAAALLVLVSCAASPRLRQHLAHSLDTMATDLRWALRSIRHQGGTTFLSVISLAIGVGVSVAVFCVVDVLMIRPLPYPEADQLVDVFGTVPARGWRTTTQSLPDILDLRERSLSMDLAGYSESSFNLSGDDRPERAQALRVSWNFFDVLRVQPGLGRAFSPGEERVGNHRVAIITAGLWQRRFAADPDVIGRQLSLDGEPHSVIGVLPESFWFEGRATEVFTPLSVTGNEPRSNRGMQSLARLEPGFTIAEAHAEAVNIAAQLEKAFPDSNSGWGAGVRPLRERLFVREIRTGSLISAAAVALLLLIVCANVANLQLARASDRRREIAVRAAFGANRFRLTRQLLTESLVVAAAGGALGSLIALVAVRTTESLLPGWLPGLETIGTDSRALGFALAVTTLTGLFFGALPALRAARSDHTPALKEGGRGAAVLTRGFLTRALVVVEVSLALMLLVCCALLVQGFAKLQSVDWGWKPDNVLTFRVALPEARYGNDESVAGFFRRLDSDLEALPGVQVAGGTEILPLRGESSTYYNAVGREVSRSERPSISVRVVIPGYFEAMGIDLITGRGITDEDRSDSRPVVVVNQKLAEIHWPAGDAVGQEIRFWGEDMEIVGITRTTLDFGPDARPMGYIPASQLPLREMSLVVHATRQPTALASSMRRVVATIDPDLPVFDLVTMTELMAEENAGYSVMPRLMAGLAAVALVLGLIGVYGVIARSVARRSREVGIRLALGAMRVEVLGLVMRQGLALVSTGVVLGLVLSAIASRSLALFLFGVSPFDPVTFASVAAILLVAGAAATFIPARRAIRVDPMQALRTE